MKLLVLGIGNVLMNDDAAGALVVRGLEEKYAGMDENLRVIEGGTLGLDLLPLLEWADRLVLADAVDLDLPAGTVVRIEGDDVAPVFENKLSPHQMGMKDLLLTAELAGYRPPEVVLYGIQVKSIQMDMTLSPEVAENCAKLSKHIEEEIENFLSARAGTE
ncbi:MAG: hydrogenase maturation protease [Deferribacterales bacterium]